MKYLSTVLMLLGIYFPGVGQAMVAAYHCNECTPAEEEALVATVQRIGFLYTYNVADARLRKFEVYARASGSKHIASLGPAGGPDGIERKRVRLTDPDEIRAFDEASGNKTPPGEWERIVVERTTDPGVARIFDVMVGLHRESPGLFRGHAVEKIPIANASKADGPHGPIDFDPRAIAWEAQTGKAAQFLTHLDDLLDSREGANRLYPPLAKLIYDVHAATKRVSIAVGKGLDTGVLWTGLPDTAYLRLCDAQDTCVRTILKLENGVTRASIENVVDAANVTLPVEADEVRREWGFNARQNALAYATWLRDYRRGTTLKIAGSTTDCRGHELVCKAAPDFSPYACTLHCNE